MARRKAAALDVPGSQAEALALVADYVTADRRALELRLGYEVQIDRLKAERDAVLALITEEQAGRFARLKAWWEAGGQDLAGKKRSAELAGATLGVRLTPKAVKFSRGIKVETIVEWLKQTRWAGSLRFLRTKVEFDKQELIAAVTSDPSSKAIAEAFANRGVTVVQTDEFFIDTQLDEAAIRTRLGAVSA
jgi:phage host-nuclease inhibitor protein Gam